MATVKFNIDVGDWSVDGHGRSDTFCVEADASDIYEVRRAYAEAAKKYPHVNPEKFCNDYEDSSVPSSVVKALEDMGCPELCGEYEGDIFRIEETDAMADWIVWFINLGAGREMCKLIPAEALNLRGPLTPDAGPRKKSAHINPSFGYGLFYS